jgi:hypothetical protein
MSKIEKFEDIIAWQKSKIISKKHLLNNQK